MVGKLAANPRKRTKHLEDLFPAGTMLKSVSKDHAKTNPKMWNERYKDVPDGFGSYHTVPQMKRWQTVYAELLQREARESAENSEDVEEASETDSAEFSDTESMCLYEAMVKYHEENWEEGR